MRMYGPYVETGRHTGILQIPTTPSRPESGGNYEEERNCSAERGNKICSLGGSFNLYFKAFCRVNYLTYCGINANRRI